MIPIAKPLVGDEELGKIKEVFDSGILAKGDFVYEFEKKFADYMGVKHAIATSNGTAALMSVANSLIKEGDEVIMPSFSFVASATSVVFRKGKPVFVDINPDTFNLDPGKIEEAVTDRTKAIMPVHLFGQPCEMEKIMEIAEKHDLLVIEDACQSHGAEYKGRKAGSFGIGCFSFYSTKNMTTGEGGIVTTNDSKLAEEVSLFINHGMKERYRHIKLGYNFRMTNIQAAIGLAQMEKLDRFNKKRVENARFYDKELKDTVSIPRVADNCKHVYHQYTIKADRRDELKAYMAKKGICTEIYYPIPIHRQQIFDLDLRLPETENACKSVLSIPVHPSLKEDEREKIAETIKDFYK